LDTAKMIGIPSDVLGAVLLDPEKQSMLAPLVDKVAFTQAINDAWALVALTTLVGLIVVPLAIRTARSMRAVLAE
jgi:DHA2 family multidrug resistance protein